MSDIKSTIQFFEKMASASASATGSCDSVSAPITKRKWIKSQGIIACPRKWDSNEDTFSCFSVNNAFLQWLHENEPNLLERRSVPSWAFETGNSKSFNSHTDLMLTYNDILWSKASKEWISWGDDKNGSVWCHPAAMRYIKSRPHTDEAKGDADVYEVYDWIDQYTFVEVEEGSLIIAMSDKFKPCAYFFDNCE
jgi:hypothetical protein